MRLLSGKKKHFWSWDYSPQVVDYQAFQIIGHSIRLKEFFYILLLVLTAL
jgi:hypothetical protein